jgi:hypothetical protein
MTHAMRPRTLFPRLSQATGRRTDATPVMLDGMEVLFDRTAGLYPVQVEPTDAVKPTAKLSSSSSLRVSRAGSGNGGARRRNGRHG